MKKHQNHRYFTAVCIASAIFAVLLCLALFLIVTGDRSELERVEAQAAVFLEQMESTIEQALENVMNRGGYGGLNPTISLNVDGQEFARLTLQDILQEASRQGYNVEVLGGGLI